MTEAAPNRLPALLAGPALAAAAAFLMVTTGWSGAAAVTLAVTLWCVVWWITEPVPIPVTSLLPLAILQVAGVLTPADIGEAYGHPLILLLLGGFILSQAMAHSGAHRRVALGMVRLFGGNSSRRLVIGFMAASAALSMWISNTATTLMLLPVALAVIDGAEDRDLAVSLLLGIAFAASLGGIGTPIGTPPNLVFMSVYRETVGAEISFLGWMAWGVPVVLVFLPLMALWLTRNLRWQGSFALPDVGAWRPEERRTLAVFALTATAWITRKEPFGGWSGLLDTPWANDASVALLAVVLMFLVPNGRGGQLLDWKTAERIPWGMLLLFGGGITIAKAFGSSGLAEALAGNLTLLADLPVVLLVAVICLTVTFMTEATSNTATTVLLMPILAAAAVAAQIDPALLMVPAAMSASCAFMLPVATAPNTIVFSSGRFSIRTMAREGVALNLLGTLVITTMVVLLVD